MRGKTNRVRHDFLKNFVFATFFELGSNEAILSRHALTLNQPVQLAELDVEGFPILCHQYEIALSRHGWRTR